jgi:alpha-galactosidase
VSVLRVNSNATFDVLDGDRVVIAGAAPEVVYRDGAGEERILRASAVRENELRGADENLEFTWSCEVNSARLEVRNRGAHTVNLERLSVLACEGDVHLGAVSELAWLQHGWQSWSPVRVRALDAPDDSYDDDDYAEKHWPHGKPRAGEATSEWFTVLGHLDARALLLGFVTATDQLAEIRLTTAGEEISSLRAICYADGIQLAAGATLCSEKLWLAFGESRALVEQYAARLGAEMKARTRLRPLSGWCTWYYFFGQNTAADLEANLARIGEERLSLELVLIDDGYQTAIGDWTSVEPDKFPSGMGAAAEIIRAAGRMPGLWLAPFGARHDSKLASDHPEFLLRDQAGQPVLAWHHWMEPVYALDLTHPGVLQHLRQLFHTVCFEWGFDLVKLDFIFAGALPGIHHDRGATRAQAFRQGLQVIRETIGDDKIILGCGAPQATSVGLVDAMRIGPDVNFMWKMLTPDPSSPALTNALRNSIFRAPFHRRLWVNDPDCVLVRKRGNLSLLSQNEARTLASLVSLTGGLTLDSDNLPEMPAARLDDLRRILPPRRDAAEVRDYFSSTVEPPHQLELRLEREWGERRVLAVTNWSARRREVSVKLPEDARTQTPFDSAPDTSIGVRAPEEGAYHVYDFWQKKYLGVQRGEVKLTQAPHATSVLLLAPVTQEQKLIASTFHLSGGAAEVKAVERTVRGLRVDLEKAGRQRGGLIFAIPDEWKGVRAKVNGRTRKVRELAAGIVAVQLVLDGQALVEIGA